MPLRPIIENCSPGGMEGKSYDQNIKGLQLLAIGASKGA